MGGINRGNLTRGRGSTLFHRPWVKTASDGKSLETILRTNCRTEIENLSVKKILVKRTEQKLRSLLFAYCELTVEDIRAEGESIQARSALVFGVGPHWKEKICGGGQGRRIVYSLSLSHCSFLSCNEFERKPTTFGEKANNLSPFSLRSHTLSQFFSERN